MVNHEIHENIVPRKFGAIRYMDAMCKYSNNDPGIIAQYYFDALKIIQGIYSTVVSVNINGVPQLHA